jgi:hypothetical protein
LTAEQFLNSIRCLDLAITAMDQQRMRVASRRQDILDQAESLGAALNGVCVQHPPGSKTENLGVQLADLITSEEVARKLNRYQERINRKIDELIDKKQHAQDVIDRIQDARYKALLTLRYIDSYKWSTVADLMGYTQDWVETRLKREAILAFEAVENNQVKTGIT